MKALITLFFIIIFVLSTGCSSKPSSKAVYMLLDTSGTYTQELDKAQAIINYLLGTLSTGDSFAVAKIDSSSFSEKDVIAKVTFADQPSRANEQKRLFKRNIDKIISHTKGSAHTDITGGVLQASQFLKETNAGTKYILIFSDLAEDLIKGHIRDFPIPLTDTQVIALNVTKLRSDNVDPRQYLKRLDAWQDRVNEGGGKWKVINDLEKLDNLLKI